MDRHSLRKESATREYPSAHSHAFHGCRLNFRGDDDAAVDNILVNVGKLYPRHDNGCEDNGEHCSTASTVPTTAASNSTVVQTSTPTNSSTSPTSSSTPSGTPTSSSAVQGPSQTSIDSHDRNMGISTGGIIGTAFGACMSAF